MIPFIFIAVVVIFAIYELVFENAPIGYEDPKSGFHYGEPPKSKS